MIIKKLNLEEVKTVYNKYIINDFPINERKPLERIILSINNNEYLTYGLFKNNKIISYAFFFGKNNQYICDYFAVVKTYRQNNYGSYFLNELLKRFKDNKIYFEVEKPEEPQKDIKEKRIQFYLKNNLILNNIEISLYYVNYLIISNTPTTSQEIIDLYHNLYPQAYTKKYFKLIKGE